MTVTIQIGNTDDRLSQSDWSSFCADIADILRDWVTAIHFAGGSPFNTPWQNACWVCSVNPDDLESFKKAITKCREDWWQDSVAVTVGTTELI